MRDVAPEERDDRYYERAGVYIILISLAVEIVGLAALTGLLVLVTPPRTSHLYGLIAGIMPLLLIALAVETHGDPITFDLTPPFPITEEEKATPEFKRYAEGVQQSYVGFLSLTWPLILLYVCVGEGAALYAAGWDVSNRIVLPLSVGPLLALAALFLIVAVSVFVDRLPTD